MKLILRKIGVHLLATEVKYYNDIIPFRCVPFIGHWEVTWHGLGQSFGCGDRKGRNLVDRMARSTLCNSSDTLSYQILYDWTRLKIPDIWKQINNNSCSQREKVVRLGFPSRCWLSEHLSLSTRKHMCFRVITCSWCGLLTMKSAQTATVFKGTVSFFYKQKLMSSE